MARDGIYEVTLRTEKGHAYNERVQAFNADEAGAKALPGGGKVPAKVVKVVTLEMSDSELESAAKKAKAKSDEIVSRAEAKAEAARAKTKAKAKAKAKARG